MNDKKLLLISYDLCPYVQRSVITLIEKNIPHNRKTIDLANPEAWFLKKSPLGKVPLLIVDDDHAIFESAVICELLDEITSGSLHPKDPFEKAKHRAWIEYGSQILDNIGSLYSSNSKDQFDRIFFEIHNKFFRLNEIIKGPFFSGKEFRMVDAVYATIFRYFDVMDAFLPDDVLENCNNVKTWRTQLEKRPSVKAAVVPEYPQLLFDFLRQRNSYISILIEKMESTDKTSKTCV